MTGRVMGCIFVLVIAVLTISGCGLHPSLKEAAGYSKAAENLGVSIAVHLKAQPGVVDARDYFTYGLDSAPSLRFTVVIAAASRSDEFMKKIYELILDDYWHSAAAVSAVNVDFYSSDNPPTKVWDYPRMIIEYNFSLFDLPSSKSADQIRLEQQFGPRPAVPPSK
jgi:hypothetical protein